MTTPTMPVLAAVRIPTNLCGTAPGHIAAEFAPKICAEVLARAQRLLSDEFEELLHEALDLDADRIMPDGLIRLTEDEITTVISKAAATAFAVNGWPVAEDRVPMTMLGETPSVVHAVLHGDDYLIASALGGTPSQTFLAVAFLDQLGICRDASNN